ncbi:hypothetical protein CASFOL_021973 [Castilleja foliolosa]|uniref:F-box domain-containing protein n=1 Tax=Castilleja foliolosa TaxID=1961234 RepID=A0ABD3CZF0_9LAMI
MNTQSTKRREAHDDDGSAIVIDKLSKLLQPVLHNILTLLSQRDAVRTSVLSKSWRYLWNGRLNVEFWEPDHGYTKFWSFLDKTLQRYLDQNLSLQQFLVYILYEVDSELLQKWIPIVIMNMGVRSFNLIFSYSTKASFPLPLVVFQSESLVELHLTRCDLNILKSTNNVMLNNLQTLRLCDVYITDEIFQKIISGCPLVENLDLLECIGLKSIKLHKHHNLKYFDFRWTTKQPSLKSKTHTLLKSLDLYKVQLPAETIDNFSSFFPCLSELILNKCYGLEEFILSSSSIKRLTIKMKLRNTKLRNMIKAFIDTPNILYFEYSGEGFLPSIKFATTSNDWTSEISLRNYFDEDATSWFLKLNKLLKALSQSHITLKIFCSNKENLQIKDSDGGLFKPVVVDHLTFLDLPSSSDPTILNCFLRICRPRYVHMDRYNDCQAKCNLVEYISKLIADETGCYFWLQGLEEVTFEVWDTKAGEWNCVQLTSLQALCNIKHQIRFRLTWKEQ